MPSRPSVAASPTAAPTPRRRQQQAQHLGEPEQRGRLRPSGHAQRRQRHLQRPPGCGTSRRRRRERGRQDQSHRRRHPRRRPVQRQPPEQGRAVIRTDGERDRTIGGSALRLHTQRYGPRPNGVVDTTTHKPDGNPLHRQPAHRNTNERRDHATPRGDPRNRRLRGSRPPRGLRAHRPPAPAVLIPLRTIPESLRGAYRIRGGPCRRVWRPNWATPARSRPPPPDRSRSPAKHPVPPSPQPHRVPPPETGRADHRRRHPPHKPVLDHRSGTRTAGTCRATSTRHNPARTSRSRTKPRDRCRRQTKPVPHSQEPTSQAGGRLGTSSRGRWPRLSASTRHNRAEVDRAGRRPRRTNPPPTTPTRPARKPAGNRPGPKAPDPHNRAPASRMATGTPLPPRRGPTPRAHLRRLLRATQRTLAGRLAKPGPRRGQVINLRLPTTTQARTPLPERETRTGPRIDHWPLRTSRALEPDGPARSHQSGEQTGVPTRAGDRERRGSLASRLDQLTEISHPSNEIHPYDIAPYTRDLARVLTGESARSRTDFSDTAIATNPPSQAAIHSTSTDLARARYFSGRTTTTSTASSRL
ncbi:hypothetical protein CLV40_10682 [Actinokineospora auranticolor]|uniref:Uncharacterized protein n=1 Tax=Actinokineospora auranticolor TaxID=155976 RepID=A0A2S6GRI5_9PSEU|nr:hypothetical protein CLV40_10682 [Actinokineospora auranticolor]